MNDRRERRLAWALMSPALLVIVGVALVPLLWTGWESLHLHDLRMPWLGHRWIGAGNFTEALSDPRFLEALAHTVFFTTLSVPIEIISGVVLALAMSRAVRARGLVRVSVLIPWAIPTVVVGLLWRFMFDSQSGIVNQWLPASLAPVGFAWFAEPMAAWVPIIAADVWKTTPFVALLLLAGLEGIDPSVYEAASIDGASTRQQFVHITLPLLAPAMIVAILFRTLDGFRVFDLIYVLTGGGPGTATEPIALYTFSTLLQNLRFGFGSALAMLAFLITFVLALLYIRLFAGHLTERVS